jgi:S-formylglutathione hydrolase
MKFKSSCALKIMCTITITSAHAICAAGLLFSQTAAHTQKGTVERVKVYGKSLAGNLEGDSPDRDVSIYLPPSYSTDRNHRYPVVYLLHGFTDDDDHWFGRIQHFIDVPAILDKALESGATREMIVVMPNAYTAFQGSMYSSSVTTGDWEGYVAQDLVSYVDSHYRTIANRESRGLAGHSMGGYGAIRIGMKHPEVFSSIYVLSPCCMNANLNPQNMARAEKIQSMAEAAKADFGTKAALASAAAWSPNPKNPPFFFDLPTKEGQLQPAVAAKWAANAPLAMVDQYLPNLRKLRAIAFDAGDKDASIAESIKVLDEILNRYELPHTFEIYGGTHISGVAERLEKKVLPFFTGNLTFPQTKR